MASLERARLYFHTLRYLRPRQVGWRLVHRVYRPRPNTAPGPSLRKPAGTWTSSIEREPSMLGRQRVRFLNREAVVDGPEAWNNLSCDKLWLYNLHYFDDLNAQSADTREAWHRELIARWIEENPPGYGNGWEPYPTSLRIVNWCRWVLRGHEPKTPMTQSLAVQARWLRRNLEYHLLGNHLLSNAKALVFAGLFFESQEADEWYRKGMRLLAHQWLEQILPDGGHFERSPMYHLLALEDLLDLINVHRVMAREVPERWWSIVSRMLEWSRVMQHPDGDVPFFNDAAMGVAGTPVELEAYASRLGITIPKERPGHARHLQQSGYARLEAGRAVALLDMAPVGPNYLPGHAHADTLSFELSIGSSRVVTNGGTSVYGRGEERQRQRSTAAHSTVVIDGMDSSEIWDSFRVARRAQVLEAEVQEEAKGRLSARASHDGYGRLPGRPMHSRTWELKPGALLVDDWISGDGEHLLEWFFPLGPGLVPKVFGDSKVIVRQEDTGKEVCCFIVNATAQTFLEQVNWHSHFGVSKETWRLRLVRRERLPVRMVTRILWSDE